MKKLVLFSFLLLINSGWGQSGPRKNGPPLLPVDEKEMPDLISSFRGKVVLVNIWATWCKPCVMEFPNLVKLQKVYEKKGVKVLFVSVDEPEVAETAVRPFLKKQGVTFPAYIKEGDDDERFINAIGEGWRGAIPTTFVYDRTGKQVSMLVGARDFSTFEGVVKPLLR